MASTFVHYLIVYPRQGEGCHLIVDSAFLGTPSKARNQAKQIKKAGILAVRVFRIRKEVCMHVEENKDILSVGWLACGEIKE